MPHVVWSLLASNRRQRVLPVAGSPSRVPGRGLAVLTCMDARLDLDALLGLNVGDAHVLRNAGGRVTSDVLRSFALSTHTLGVREIGIIHHTGCGLEGARNGELSRRTGLTDVDFLPFHDVHESVKADVATVVDSGFLAEDTVVWGAVCRLDRGSVSLVCGPATAS
jgi:carbonic anhydrase